MIARLRRYALPRGKALIGSSIYGVLNFGIGYALLYIALLRLGAGTASVIMATVPLITLTLAVIHGQERFTARGIVGGLLAVCGIAVISIHSIGSELPLTYVLVALGGAFAVSESSVLLKSFPKSHPITTNAIGMASGATFLTLASLIGRETWVIPTLPKTWLVLVWLVLVGSVGLFTLFVYVIGRWTASASVYALTLMPVVAITLGVILANETVTPKILAGGALVICGVYVGALSQTRKKPA